MKMSASGTEKRRMSNVRWRWKNKGRTKGRVTDDGNRGHVDPGTGGQRQNQI